TASEIVVIHKGRKIQHADPETLLQLLEGQVWQWTVPAERLPALKQTLTISSTIRRNDGIQVRVVSPGAPDADALPVSPNLEDVYLALISQERNQP
ncbi:MAG: ABC transporter ATP-binding protein, partial [Anaerolineae bacterium]|nr:ABC transporter ATP-binding protein [Anaerolineae bacterium]